jgi:hypothetical protein
MAVEEGELSITAEGTAATRAIFNMHPDEKIRKMTIIWLLTWSIPIN